MGPQRSDVFFDWLDEHLPALTQALNRQTSSCGYPVYCSLDLRDAGWKVVAVDVNLFPAGFNNLTRQDHARAATKMREFLSAKLFVPGPWKVTVVPEAHTNNQGYLENLAGILSILRDAGCHPLLLWPGDPLPKAWKIQTTSGTELEYLPPDQALKGSQALILNHDLSGGIPAVLKNVSLPTFPSTQLGWYRRRKSNHQEIVESLLERLAREVPGFDPWYFSLRTQKIENVNFENSEDLARVATQADEILKTLTEDYRARDIPETPRLFLKNDAGTYGMGVVSVKNGEEILNASRSFKNKMRKGKESVPISQVILQEAVPTALIYAQEDGSEVAGEPVLYLINGLPIGGFCRIHEKLGTDAAWQNLNQPGSLLEPLDCDRTPPKNRPFPKPRGSSPCHQIGFQQIYSFIAKLHATAAGLEECPS